MSVNVKSPARFVFDRSGGADIQSVVQIWIKKDAYGPADKPVTQLGFQNPLQSHETQSATLPPGAYIAVFLAMAREALNGVYAMRLAIDGEQVYAKEGDVNADPTKLNEIQNFVAKIELNVA